MEFIQTVFIFDGSLIWVGIIFVIRLAFLRRWNTISKSDNESLRFVDRALRVSCLRSPSRGSRWGSARREARCRWALRGLSRREL